MYKVLPSEISEVNPFVMKEHCYVRDINPIKHYVEQQAFHLAKQTGQTYERCLEFVTKVVRTRNNGKAVNPTVKFLERQENGDREPRELPLTKYLNEIIKNEEIIAPTLTTYKPNKVMQSILGLYIQGNIKRRSIAKKAAQAAKAAGNIFEFMIQNGRQRNRKLSNNAISGAHASSGTPLSNKTNHSTLTSNCRMTSGQGNANNEKFLSGHRHYWKPDIAYNNVISIIQNTDYTKFEAVMTKYKLHYPTAEEALACITRSTRRYCPGRKSEDQYFQLLQKLNPLELAAFVYTGDLYHLRKYNDAFMREFIGTIAKPGDVVKTQDFFAALGSDDPAKAITKLIHSTREEELLLAHCIISDDMRGKGKDYGKMFAKGDIDTLSKLHNTARHARLAIESYVDFIEVIMVSNNVPASVAHFPSAVRESALTSDTDSTIFTVQEWVQWYFGKLIFTNESIAFACTMIYLAAQAITHILGRMSINCGVAVQYMWLIAMKNEFFFPVFVPTLVSKHYWAYTYITEGNVAKKFEREKKGVHLKSSNAPQEINDEAEEMMFSFADHVINGTQIKVTDYIKQVADTERKILASIQSGDPKYTRRGSIKSPESYAQEQTKSNYNHYLLWKMAFAPKYGYKEAPPYAVVKLSGSHDKPSDTQAWLNTLDKEVKEGVKEWMKLCEKEKMGAFMIPKGYVDQNGIPPEILAAADTRKMVSDISKIFYLILNTLGLNVLDEKKTVLLSDYY